MNNANVIANANVEQMAPRAVGDDTIAAIGAQSTRYNQKLYERMQKDEGEYNEIENLTRMVSKINQYFVFIRTQWPGNHISRFVCKHKSSQTEGRFPRLEWSRETNIEELARTVHWSTSAIFAKIAQKPNMQQVNELDYYYV